MAGERIAFRKKRTPQPHPDMLRGRVRRRRVPGIGDATPTNEFSDSAVLTATYTTAKVRMTLTTQTFARGEMDGGVAGDLASGLYQE
jgi:hypothetical protein